MTAAQTIKTPVMVLPPRRGSPDPLSDMHLLARRLRRISLGEVVAGEWLFTRTGTLHSTAVWSRRVEAPADHRPG